MTQREAFTHCVRLTDPVSLASVTDPIYCFFFGHLPTACTCRMAHWLEEKRVTCLGRPGHAISISSLIKHASQLQAKGEWQFLAISRNLDGLVLIQRIGYALRLPELQVVSPNPIHIEAVADGRRPLPCALFNRPALKPGTAWLCNTGLGSKIIAYHRQAWQI